MFENIRAKWNAAKQQRFDTRVAKYMRNHFSEVLGSDDKTLDEPDAIKKLHSKYFGS